MDFNVIGCFTFKVCLKIAAKSGLSPSVISTFQGGRIEQFVDNSRTWSVDDLRDPKQHIFLVKGNREDRAERWGGGGNALGASVLEPA